MSMIDADIVNKPKLVAGELLDVTPGELGPDRVLIEKPDGFIVVGDGVLLAAVFTACTPP